MRRVIEEMRGRYEYVVIDSAPLMPVTDSVELSTLVDGVVLVAKHRWTSTKMLKKSVELFERVDAKVLGIVLNFFSINASGYRYREYKRYYYSYYHQTNGHGRWSLRKLFQRKG